MRVGVEYGFMSTTADEAIALGYSSDPSQPRQPRSILSAEMTATSRGAFVGWLSQYPDEVEFIYAPLCCIEVVKGSSPTVRHGVLHFAMIFSQNATCCEPQSLDAVPSRWPGGSEPEPALK